MIRASNTYEGECGCGRLYVTCVSDEDGGITRIHVHFGKAGGCASAIVQALADLSNLAITSGIPVQKLITTLMGMSCHNANLQRQPEPLESCITVVSRMMAKHLKAHGGEPDARSSNI